MSVEDTGRVRKQYSLWKNTIFKLALNKRDVFTINSTELDFSKMKILLMDKVFGVNGFFLIAK